MEKPKLFLDYREFVVVVVFLLFIFMIRIGFLYSGYKEFVSKPFYYTQANVLQQYNKSKNGKSYSVLRLQSREGQSFYTTSYLKEDLRNKILRVKLYTNETIGFLDYLGIFYIKTRLTIIGDRPLSARGELLERVALQHSNPRMSALYQAIFLASPLPQSLRKNISALGVSHLVALSGFHLTILWGLVYGLLGLLYRPVQQRYFPYRMMLLDIGIATLMVLGYYLWLVGSPPSLLRSYSMALIVWIVLIAGIELISFELLGFVVMLLLALFPSLVVSYGFYFSVVGVFYIYLVLHWSRGDHKLLITLLYIPVGIFLLMLPIVHGVFGIVTLWQFFSPLLSLLFILFYPLSILLHLLGYGGVFDSHLEMLLNLPQRYSEHILPAWVIVTYVLFSLGAMRSRILFALTLLWAIGYAFFLIALF